MFTQPLMYKKIRTHKNSHQRYVERLLEEGSLIKAQVRRAMALVDCMRCLARVCAVLCVTLLEEGSTAGATRGWTA
jgi:hypothetical protein